MEDVEIIEGVNGKACSKCDESKLFGEFSKSKGHKYGVRSECKECQKEKRKEHYENNKEKMKDKNKKYRESNKEKIREYRESNKEKIREYRESNKEKIKECNKEYRESNKEKIREYRKEYQKSNKEKIREYLENNKEKISKRGKKYRENNKEKVKEKNKKYYNNNKEQIIKYQNTYAKQRKKIDPLFHITSKIRTRVGHSFRAKNWTKRSHTFDMIKLTPEDFFLYIESQFKKGMSWDNRELWQFDHKVPLGLAKTEEELIKLNHYSNFQPLWNKENATKSMKLLPKHKKLMFELIGR